MSSAPGVSRRHARALYKELIKYSKVHPDLTKRKKYVYQIRKDFRRNASESNESTISKLLEKGTSRLGFLRMQVPTSAIPIRHRLNPTHPKSPNNNNIDNTDSSTHSQTSDTDNAYGRNARIKTYSIDETGNIAASVSRVIRNARFTNWCDGNNDPDEKRKHESHIERFLYRGPYWEKRRKGWLPQEAIDIWKGPTYSEYLMNPDKYDIGFEIGPTDKLDDHPDLKNDEIIDIAMRKDFGIDNEPDVERHVVKPTGSYTLENFMQGAKEMYLGQEADRAENMPTVTEFLRGKREK